MTDLPDACLVTMAWVVYETTPCGRERAPTVTLRRPHYPNLEAIGCKYRVIPLLVR